MIHEDYVSFETTKLLKEKGFDEPTTHWYNVKKDLINDYLVTYKNFFQPEKVWLAPTHQSVLKWLREAKDIFIDIETNYTYVNNAEDTQFEVTGWSFVIHTDEDPCYEDEDTYDTYEDAVEAAISYSLGLI